jgi:adenine/guanine phosphoribosyltransferase-like PRPP-binding protein
MMADVVGLTANFMELLIERQPGMRVVDWVRAAELEEKLEKKGADVVVTALSSAEVPAAYHGLVFRVPSIPIVAIGADRRRVQVYNGTVIQEVELDQLVGVIRDLVSRRPEQLA